MDNKKREKDAKYFDKRPGGDDLPVGAGEVHGLLDLLPDLLLCGLRVSAV
jgi:hypothetical protein